MSNGIPFWPVCDVTQKAQSSMSNFVPVYKVAIETFFEVYDLFKKVVYHRVLPIAITKVYLPVDFFSRGGDIVAVRSQTLLFFCLIKLLRKESLHREI